MKKYKLYKKIFAVCLFVFLFAKTYATSYTWNGNTSTAWATTANWTPNGTPTSSDNVTITSSGTYAPVLAANVTVNNFTITGKTLDLNGDTLIINGTGSFSGGTITNGLLKPSGSTIQFSGTVIDAKVDAVVTKVLLDGSTFNKKCYFEATSNIPGTSAGGCTFNDTVTIKRSYTGSGIMYLANSSGNVYNKLVTLINVGTKEIVTTTTGGSKFNENVIVENTSSGGINFGYSTTGGDTLASGKTVTISSNGFTTGTLLFCNFTQLGSTAQSLTVTSSAIINLIRATFNGNVTLTAPGILCKASTFNGTFASTTNGSTNTSWSGYNVFNGDASITNTSTSADVRLDNDSANTFYGNLTLTTSSSKDIKMCFSSSTTSVYGNVTGNNSHVTFNSGTGTLAFRGGSGQTFNSPGAIVKDVLLKKSANSVTLDTTLTCTATFTFNKGNIVTSANHLLVFNAGSSVSGASDTSFVCGPVKKVGNSAFVFPTGKGSDYRAVEISAPGSSGDAFTGEYFSDTIMIHSSARDSALGYIQRNKYWKLNRVNGTSNVNVTLAWNRFCAVNDTANIYVAGWNGSKWKSFGHGVTTKNASNGTVKSNVSVTDYNEFALSYGSSVSSACAGAATIINPFAYYTLDVTNGGTIIDPSDFIIVSNVGPGSALSAIPPNASGSGLGNYVSNTSTTQSPITASTTNFTNNIIAVEFLFKLDENFPKQRTARFFEFRDVNNTDKIYGALEYPNLYFNWAKDNGATVTENRFTILLDGIGRRNFDYYTDGNWHHMYFRYNSNFNATDGRLEIWVDGQLNTGFSFQDAALKGTLLNINNTINLLPSTNSYDKFLGQMDNIAIYDINICDEQIYNNYNVALPSGPGIPQANYCFNNASCPINSISIPTSATYLTTEDPMEYPSGVIDPIDQLKKFTLARYLPGHTLNKNFNSLQSDYLGRRLIVSNALAIPSSLDIQKELASHWYYHFNAIENTKELQNLADFNLAWLNYAKVDPLNFSVAISTNHSQVVPTDAFYSNVIPYIKTFDINYLSYTNYLNNGTSSTFLTNVCPTPGTSGNPACWSPAGNQSAYDKDGLTQKHYFDLLFNTYSFNRKISLIVENNETLGPFLFKTNGTIACAPSSDPACISAQSTSGLSWTKYIAREKIKVDNDYYRDKFLDNTVSYWNCLQNSMFLNYQVDGHTNPEYRFDYEYTRETQTVYSIDQSSVKHYLPTPDFYLFNSPANWFAESLSNPTLQHGIKWIDITRNNEINNYGDLRFAPYIAAGWSDNDNEHARPGQWLGLMKCLGLYGVDFYHVGHFNDSYNLDPDAIGWCWQAATPIYAHAILSRVENFLKNGDLMAGDIPVNLADPSGNKSYRFSANSPSNLVVVRQLKNISNALVNRFVLSGAIESLGNLQYNAETVKRVKISLPQISLANVNLDFYIRRQGNTYIFDNTNPYSTGEQVFYQLDRWHQYEHPEYWTKDFHFEAEVFDNSPNALIKTRDGSNAAITNGDFHDFTSFVTYNNGTTADALEYHFTPRNDSYANDYVLFIRARVRTTGSTAIKVNINAQNGSQSFAGRFSGISSTSWTWYRLTCNGSAVNFGTLNDDIECILSLLPENDLCEIDQIYLDSPDPLYYPVNPTTGGFTNVNSTFTVSISGTASACTGQLGAGSLTASVNNCGNGGSFTYLWNTGQTTATINNVSPFTIYTVTVSDGTNTVSLNAGINSSTTYDFINPVISANTLWDNSINSTTTIKVLGVVTIENGATLTIDNGMTIETSYGPSPDVTCDGTMLRAGFVVNVGGKLDVQPGAILTGCSNGIWDGIEAMSDYNATQSPTTNQGHVDINGTSTDKVEIRNAVCGVRGLKAPGMACDPKLGGGIVTADYCVFVDNYNSVLMINYPGAQTGVTSASYFDHCEFQFTNNYMFTALGYGPPSMLNLTNHHGVRIANSTFSCTNTSATDYLKGRGIYAMNSTFFLRDLSGSGAGNNTFTDLTEAVEAVASTSATGTCVIEGNTFTDNLHGISGNGFNSAIIRGNTFTIPDNANGNDTWGIFIDGANDVEIKNGNTFTGNNSTNNIAYGVDIRNTGGTAPIVNGNTFTDLTVGTQTEGDNPDLNIYCNDYTNGSNSQAGWLINPNSYSSGEDLQDQGDCGLPYGAGDNFNSSGGGVDIDNWLITAWQYRGYNNSYAPTSVTLSNNGYQFVNCGNGGTENCPSSFRICNENDDECIRDMAEVIDTVTDAEMKNIMMKEIVQYFKLNNLTDDLIEFLETQSDLESKKALFEVYLAAKQYEDANAIFMELEEEEPDEAYLDYYGVLLGLLEGEREITEMNETELGVMDDISRETNQLAERAKAVINYLTPESFARIPEKPEEARLLNHASSTKVNVVSELSLTNYPNPFNENSTIEIENYEDYKGSTLRIENVVGEMLKAYSIVNKSCKFELKAIDFSPGIYLYSIINKDNVRVSIKNFSVIK